MTYQEALVTLTADDQQATWDDGQNELTMVTPEPGTVALAEWRNGRVVWEETFTSPHKLISAIGRYDAFEGWMV